MLLEDAPSHGISQYASSDEGASTYPKWYAIARAPENLDALKSHGLSVVIKSVNRWKSVGFNKLSGRPVTFNPLKISSFLSTSTVLQAAMSTLNINGYAHEKQFRIQRVCCLKYVGFTYE